MRTFKKVRRLIENDPLSPQARVLATLVTALESDVTFAVKDLYTLDEKHFDLAIDLLSDWRLDRYYLGKAKVFDVALQAQAVQSSLKTSG